MLELICYLLAVTFGILAVFPMSMDRVQLLSAAFVCFMIPLLVRAAEAV